MNRSRLNSGSGSRKTSSHAIGNSGEEPEGLSEELEQRYRDEFERTLDAKVEAVLEAEKD